MSDFRFSWNRDKNRLNKQKHGISFDEAETVFDDENAIYIVDEKHSLNEERFIVIGYSGKARLLVVCHCYRGNDDVIRIISARKANGQEAGIYEGG